MPKDYVGKMDAECLPLCDALNEWPSIETMYSCCGHGEEPFCIGIHVEDYSFLPVLHELVVFELEFNWSISLGYSQGEFDTFFTFFIKSTSMGEEAYKESLQLAEALHNYWTEERWDWYSKKRKILKMPGSEKKLAFRWVSDGESVFPDDTLWLGDKETPVPPQPRKE